VAIVAVLAVGGAGFYFWTPISDKLLGQSSTTSSAAPSTTTTSSPTPTSTTPSSSSPAPTTSVAAPPPAALVDPADLQSYLAKPDELSKRFGGADMQPVALGKQPVSDIDVDPYKCSGAAVPGISQAWGGSGFTGFVNQVVNDSAGAHKFVQTLGTFPTAEAANAFVSSQLSRWKDCAFTNLTITIGGKGDKASTGAAFSTDGMNTIVLTPPTPGSRQCERAMTSSGNVVIDVRACAVDVGTAGSATARDISQKIAGPR